jgi:hypothetical protein
MRRVPLKYVFALSFAVFEIPGCMTALHFEGTGHVDDIGVVSTILVTSCFSLIAASIIALAFGGAKIFARMKKAAPRSTSP